MKNLTATLLALGTTLALMAPAHADDMDKGKKGTDDTMMQDDMKEDGMAKDSMKSDTMDTMHDGMKTESMMDEDMKKEGMEKDAMKKDGMSEGDKTSM